MYKRKAGEEITQQMYAFNDKSDPPHEVTLRPEMTPSLARMVLARAQSHSLPLKWSSIPQVCTLQALAAPHWRPTPIMV